MDVPTFQQFFDLAMSGPLFLGFLGGLVKGIGKIVGKAAPVASLIPGVGTAASIGMGLAGKALGGGGGAPGAPGGGGGSTWDTLGKIGSVAGGVWDAVQGSKKQGADIRSQQARDAIEKGMLDLNRDKFGEDKRQFDGTMGLNRDKLGEEQRQWDQKFGLENSKFDKERETEQFGRARNTRFAKVRAPFAAGLMSGRTFADDPAAQARLAKLGG